MRGGGAIIIIDRSAEAAIVGGDFVVKFAEAALSQVQRRVSALAKVDAANLRLAIDGASGIDPGVLAILERLEKVQN